MQIENKYIEKLKSKAQENKGTQSEWNEIVGEITDFLNEERKGTPYPPLESKRVAQMVGYIWTKGGAGDLRKFRDDVRSKGAWFFWWVTKPKKDPNASFKR